MGMDAGPGVQLSNAAAMPFSAMQIDNIRSDKPCEPRD